MNYLFLGLLDNVALLAESVDRNVGQWGLSYRAGSLSLRRAWIEIATEYSANVRRCVALLAESVDRNGSTGVLTVSGNGRSPQGERG